MSKKFDTQLVKSKEQMKAIKQFEYKRGLLF